MDRIESRSQFGARPFSSMSFEIATGLGSPITRFTSAADTARPAAASASRTQRLTASSSFTVVPAMSKTTSSISSISPTP